MKLSHYFIISLLCLILPTTVYAQNNDELILPSIETIKLSFNQHSFDDLIKKLPKNADLSDPLLILVNKENRLKEEPAIPFVYSDSGLPYHEVLATPLAQLREAAALEGFYYHFVSGYRSMNEQQINRDNRYYNYLAEGYSETDATYMTDLFYAPSNGSEHTTGLAVDLLGVEWGEGLMTDYQYQPSAQWLADHAHEYGFILRYTDGKSDITGIHFEPWHFRYVGIEHATFMHEYGLVLEEYLALIKERNKQ